MTQQTGEQKLETLKTLADASYAYVDQAINNLDRETFAQMNRELGETGATLQVVVQAVPFVVALNLVKPSGERIVLGIIGEAVELTGGTASAAVH